MPWVRKWARSLQVAQGEVGLVSEGIMRSAQRRRRERNVGVGGKWTEISFEIWEVLAPTLPLFCIIRRSLGRGFSKVGCV